jgi:hypothetical protein
MAGWLGGAIMGFLEFTRLLVVDWFLVGDLRELRSRVALGLV